MLSHRNFICGTKVSFAAVAHLIKNNFAFHLSQQLFEATLPCLPFCLDAGGRIFVAGIYIGLLASIFFTFSAFNKYIIEFCVFNEESPYFSTVMVQFMRRRILQSFVTCEVIAGVLALFSLYVCV